MTILTPTLASRMLDVWEWRRLSQNNPSAEYEHTILEVALGAPNALKGDNTPAFIRVQRAQWDKRERRKAS